MAFRDTIGMTWMQLQRNPARHWCAHNIRKRDFATLIDAGLICRNKIKRRAKCSRWHNYNWSHNIIILCAFNFIFDSFIFEYWFITISLLRTDFIMCRILGDTKFKSRDFALTDTSFFVTERNYFLIAAFTHCFRKGFNSFQRIPKDIWTFDIYGNVK